MAVVSIGQRNTLFRLLQTSSKLIQDTHTLQDMSLVLQDLKAQHYSKNVRNSFGGSVLENCSLQRPAVHRHRKANAIDVDNPIFWRH